MQARMQSPVLLVPPALDALRALNGAALSTGLPTRIAHLVTLRASQINGCSVCVDMHAHDMRKAGEPDERIFTVAAWRDTPYFADDERAALALTESMTRLADAGDAVPDAVFEAAADQLDEKQLAGLLLAIAGINAFNRINVASRTITGTWVQNL